MGKENRNDVREAGHGEGGQEHRLEMPVVSIQVFKNCALPEVRVVLWGNRNLENNL